MPAAYPIASDLTTRLAGLGIASLPAGVDASRMISAAISALHSAVGYSPFLAEVTSQTYRYDPSRRSMLDLRGMFTQIDEVRVDGAEWAEGTDYWPKPDGGPFTHLDLYNSFENNPLTITVEGKKGYSATVPDDVFDAILDYAVGSVYELASFAGTVSIGPRTEIEQDDVKWKFAGGSQAQGQDTASKLKDRANKVFARYRRLNFGGVQ